MYTKFWYHILSLSLKGIFSNSIHVIVHSLSPYPENLKYIDKELTEIWRTMKLNKKEKRLKNKRENENRNSKL